MSVFAAPTALFEDLREYPRWWVPFVIFLVIAILATILPRLLLPDAVLIETLRQNLPQGIELSPDQILTRMRSPAALAINGLMGAAFSGVLTVLLSLFFWGLFAVMGEKSTFVKTLSVVSYSSLVKSIGVLLVIALMLILGRREVYTSLALLPFLEQGSFMFNLAAQFDLFTIWRMAIMGVGFAVMFGTSRQKSFLSVFIPWVLFAVVIATLMSTTNFAGFGVGR